MSQLVKITYFLKEISGSSRIEILHLDLASYEQADTGYTHYHIEMSKLIRLGELSREEALSMLEINFDLNLVNSVLSKIGCRLES